METVYLNSLKELDSLIAESFDLPLRPYSTDLRAALELTIWQFDNSDCPHFEVFRSGAARPEEPFLASFEPDAWDCGATPSLAICKSALRYLKRMRVLIQG